ncbi:MAG: hypothetical protein NWF06_04455 [Candidatus Bathyarchaeota archaeon]|nr:hypothetical protein [Candidatus Bathyarchaeum sp.]
MVETSDGGFALAGSVSAFGAGGSDFWLVKTDSSGNMEWNKTYGGEEGDYVNSLIKTSDGGFALAGETDSFGAKSTDFWLVKTDANGNVEWNKTYGQLYQDYAHCVVETSDGGFVLAGYTLSLVGDLEDFLLIKTDSSGNMQWNHTYGGADRQYAYSVVETSDGGFALAGYSSFSNSDFWLVKTDAQGSMQWNKTYGGESLDRAYSMVQASDGGFMLAGKTQPDANTIVFWLVKTDSSGNMEWNLTSREAMGWGGYPLITTSDGGFAVASRYYGNLETTGNDCWLIKADINGNVELNQTYPEQETQSVGAIIQTSDGGFVIGGSNHIVDPDGDFWLLRIEEYKTPEFPVWITIPLFLATILVVIVYLKKRHKTPNN